MASTDARPVPIKNTAFRHYFGIFKNDGTLITSATGLDSEVSKDGAAFADCTNEATEISQGLYYLDLTSSEMNADCTLLVVKSSSTGAVPVVVSFFPQETGDIKTDVQSWLGTAAATPTTAGVPEVDVTHIDGDATAAQLAKRAFGNMQLVTISTGSTSTSITTNLTEATSDQYKGRALYFLTGNLAGEIVEITAYNGSTKALTVTATPTGESPANSDLALIV